MWGKNENMIPVSDEVINQEDWSAESVSFLELVYSSLTSMESVYSFTFQKYVPQSLCLKGYVRRKNKIKICY